MALIDRILLRDKDATARAEAIREFKRIMPARGGFSELAESGITAYYDKKFGQFEPAHDRWEEGCASAVRANPSLLRIDVIADSVFKNGGFELCAAGPVRSDVPPFDHEGIVAAIRLSDRPGIVTGMLTLDIGGGARFSKLRIGTIRGNDFLVRLSLQDRGMTIGPNRPVEGGLPETIHQRAAEGSEVFQTISETIVAIERILRGNSK